MGLLPDERAITLNAKPRSPLRLVRSGGGAVGGELAALLASLQRAGRELLDIDRHSLSILGAELAERRM